MDVTAADEKNQRFQRDVKMAEVNTYKWARYLFFFSFSFFITGTFTFANILVSFSWDFAEDIWWKLIIIIIFQM